MNILPRASGILCCIAVLSSSAQVPIPTDLKPGDQYRLIYVTTGTVVPNQLGGDISTYNLFANSDAAGSPVLSQLGATWLALASASVSARENSLTEPGTDGFGISIYNLNDERLADNYADLWDGSLAAPVGYDRDGISVSTGVFTGSASDGTSNAHLAGLSNARAGHSSLASSSWMDVTVTSGDNALPIYAISEVLVVPVPEAPSWGAATTLGLVAFGLYRRARPRLSRFALQDG